MNCFELTYDTTFLAVLSWCRSFMEVHPSIHPPIFVYWNDDKTHQIQY